MGKFVGQPLNPLFFIENPLNFFRKLQELLDIVICFLSADAFPHLAEKNADEINRRQLSAVGLGRCHGNLRSGPGVKTLSASLAIELPTTFTMPSTGKPRFFDSRRAARESAVSPDWLTITTSVCSERIGFR